MIYLPEQRFELQPYGVRYLCNCGTEMEYTEEMIMVLSGLFVHKCSSCGNTENLREKYPLVRWENK